MEINKIYFFGFLICLLACNNLPQNNNHNLLTLVGKLPSQIDECSGMRFVNGKLVLLNDGGGGPFLYELNQDFSKVDRKVEVKGSKNIDWESLAVDDKYIYIGEFGNNEGKRKNLRVEMVGIDSFLVKEEVNISGALGFAYKTQNSFSAAQNHNFDCEGFLTFPKGKLTLFSKNRMDNFTSIYHLNNDFTYSDSIQIVKTIENLDIIGQATDVARFPNSSRIVLLCYNYSGLSFHSFIEIIEMKENGTFKKIETIDLHLKEQAEAIEYYKNGQFLIGTEREILKGGNLYLMDLSKYMQ